MLEQFVRADPTDPVPHLMRFQHRGRPAFLQLETASHEVYDDQAYLRNRRYAGGHQHDVYHILLYTGGRNAMLLHDAVHPCQRGVLVCTAPQEPHEFRPREPAEVSYCQVTFSAWQAGRPLRVSMNELLRAFGQVSLPRVDWPVQLNQRQTRHLWSTIASLFLRAQGEPRLRPLNMALGLAEVLHALAELVLDQTPVDAEDPLEAARLAIDKQFNAPLAVSELAGLAGCSEGHFHRRFKARFGVSPVAYQIGLRIQAARNLLINSDYSLTEIADRLGFGDRYHFSRAFRNHVGTPPGRYRRQFRPGR